jgi:hypothetical protein
MSARRQIKEEIKASQTGERWVLPFTTGWVIPVDAFALDA